MNATETIDQATAATGEASYGIELDPAEASADFGDNSADFSDESQSEEDSPPSQPQQSQDDNGDNVNVTGEDEAQRASNPGGTDTGSTPESFIDNSNAAHQPGATENSAQGAGPETRTNRSEEEEVLEFAPVQGGGIPDASRGPRHSG